MNLRPLLPILALTFCWSSAQGEPLRIWNQPSVADDPRTIALGGAVTTIGTAWSALNHNPAGINQTRQYVSSMGYVIGGEPSDHGMTVAATDSLMNPAVSLGLSYSRLILGGGTEEESGGGNIFRGALVVSERGEAFSFHLGATFHHSDLDLPTSETPSETSDLGNSATSISAFNMNVGILMVINHAFRIGVLGRNLLDKITIGQSRDIVSGVGLVVGPMALEYSATIDFETCDKYTGYCKQGGGVAVSHASGIELTPTPSLPIRIGYRYDSMLQKHIMSGGLGFVTPQFGLEGAYARDLGGEGIQWFGLTARYFPNIPGT